MRRGLNPWLKLTKLLRKGIGAKPSDGPNEVMHILREAKNNFRG